MGFHDAESSPKLIAGVGLKEPLQLGMDVFGRARCHAKEHHTRRRHLHQKDQRAEVLVPREHESVVVSGGLEEGRVGRLLHIHRPRCDDVMAGRT